MTIESISQARATTQALSDADALALANVTDSNRLLPAAAAIRDQGYGDLVTVSRKVFIPLTQLCRDVCHYCTFAKTPGRRGSTYLTRDEVLAIARAGAAAGCDEALFTLGDRPERAIARRARRWRRSAMTAPCRICTRWRRRCSTRPASCRISTPVS